MSQFFKNFQALGPLLLLCFFSFNTIAQVNIAGSVLNDGTGVEDSTIDGDLFDSTDNYSLQVYLVRSSDGRIMDTAHVSDQNGYSLAGSQSVQYTVVLSTNHYASGAYNPSPTLDTDWVFAGEQYGTNNSSGTGIESGSPDGVIALNSSSTSVTGVNFGINKRPEAGNISVYLSKTPNMNNSQDLKTGGYEEMYIVDPESSDTVWADGTKLRITSLAGMNGNELKFKGKTITGDTIIEKFRASNLKIKFIGSGSTGLNFEYSIYDSAGFHDLTSATYQVSWFGALPVVWNSFTAKLTNQHVLLEWSTAMEWNNNYFVVEQFTGKGNFEPIGTVEAVGCSNEINSYSFIHTNPVLGMNYYRITQVDFDGSTSHTKTIAIDHSAPLQVQVFPNPFENSFSLTFEDPEIGKGMRIAILDQAGKIISSYGMNNSTTGIIEINMQSCKPGFYFVRLSKEDHVRIHKVFKH